jgi:hypothetical protein
MDTAVMGGRSRELTAGKASRSASDDGVAPTESIPSQNGRRAAVFAAHERVMNRELAILDAAGVPLATNRWRGALLALAARCLQLQRLVHDAAVLGYDEELTPSARAMLSALVTLAYIGRGRSFVERESRTLAWVHHQQGSQDRLYEYLWRTGTPKKQVDAQRAEQTAASDAMLAEAAARGVLPAKKVGKVRTWTGLNEYELFSRVGYRRFYKHYYALWSDESHAGPTSVNSQVGQAATGALSIGPQGTVPWFLLYATAQFGVHTVAQMNKLFRLKQDDAIRALWGDIQTDFSKIIEAERAAGELAS